VILRWFAVAYIEGVDGVNESERAIEKGKLTEQGEAKDKLETIETLWPFHFEGKRRGCHRASQRQPCHRRMGHVLLPKRGGRD
jgi:hypothetical protein